MQLLPKGVDIVPGLVAGLPGSGKHNVPGLLAGFGREHQTGDCAARRPPPLPLLRLPVCSCKPFSLSTLFF